MYQGKHIKPRKKRRLRWSREFLILCSVAILLTGIIGGTLAYLTTATDPVVNNFTPSKVDCEVTEDQFNGVTKTNVAVKNTGDTDAYIRATLVITWQDETGNISGVPVEASDYKMELATGTGWVPSDGYYYYTKSVAPGGSTGTLISSLIVTGEAPAGYHLSVEILAEAIQSKGTDLDGKTPAELAWGVNPTTLG